MNSEFQEIILHDFKTIELIKTDRFVELWFRMRIRIHRCIYLNSIHKHEVFDGKVFDRFRS